VVAVRRHCPARHCVAGRVETVGRHRGHCDRLDGRQPRRVGRARDVLGHERPAAIGLMRRRLQDVMHIGAPAAAPARRRRRTSAAPSGTFCTAFWRG